MRVDDPDDRSIQLASDTLCAATGASASTKGRTIHRTWLHSTVADAVRSAPSIRLMPRRRTACPSRSRSGRPTRRRPGAGRAVRGTHGRDDGLGDPGAVRRGQPARGGLAGRRHAGPRRAAAGRAGRRGRPSSSPARARSRCSTARPGHPRAARADLRGDGAGGHPGRPERRRGHRRLADGAGPGHPHLLRPRRRRPRRGAVLRRRARAASRRTRRRSCTSRWTTTGWSRRRCARRCATLPRQRRRAEVPLHGPELPQPGRRDAVRRAARARCSTICRGVRRRRLEDNPYGLLGFSGQHLPGAAARIDRGRHLPRLVLQDVRAGPAGRLGAGAARRAREAGAGRRVGDALPADASPRCSSSRYLATHDWREPDQDVHRGLPRAPRRDARARWRPTCPTVPRGPSRTAASTSG